MYPHLITLVIDGFKIMSTFRIRLMDASPAWKVQLQLGLSDAVKYKAQQIKGNKVFIGQLCTRGYRNLYKGFSLA